MGYLSFNCINGCENAVREHSLRLGYKADCHLILFSAKNSFSDNRKILRKKLLQEVEKRARFPYRRKTSY